MIVRFLALAAGLLLTAAAPASAETVVGQAKVVDGDTLKIAEFNIRMLGIDAPEKAQRCYLGQLAYRCGVNARDALVGEIAGRPVTCEISGKPDRYGRGIGRCFAGGEDLSGWMVRHGWAVAYRQYSQDYVAAEKAAHAARAGIWRGAFETPADWRKAKRRQ